jgi:glycosyltransferase involved in cell wall biosynthesis
MTQVDLSVASVPRKLGRFASAMRLSLELRRRKPDLIHVHYARGLAWGLLLGPSCPMVLTPWGSDVLREQGAFREWYSLPLTRSLFGRAAVVTVHSDYMESRIRHLLKPRQPVARIGWGVDLAMFRPGLDRDPSAAALKTRWAIDDRHRVVFSPRLAQPFYRLDRIVQAWPFLLAACPDALLVLSEQSADPAYLAGLRRLVEDLGLQEQVRFVGAIPYGEMPLWLNLAEAVVMVPQSDGMPNSLWEAMACGAVPVLADLPQYREVIRHREHGWLVPPDPEGIAAALRELLGDAAGCEAMRQRNRALVGERADQGREMARMESWYAALAARQVRRELATAGPLSR